MSTNICSKVNHICMCTHVKFKKLSNINRHWMSFSFFLLTLRFSSNISYSVKIIIYLEKNQSLLLLLSYDIILQRSRIEVTILHHYYLFPVSLEKISLREKSVTLITYPQLTASCLTQRTHLVLMTPKPSYQIDNIF